MRKMMNRIKDGDSRGFTLLEVLVSMAITVIVMGAVFGLLTQGQQSFQREPQIADLQQSARSALDMVARDVLQAGANLPPEFPALTPSTNDPAVGDGGANPDVVEIVGAMQSTSVIRQDPEELAMFNSATLQGEMVGLQTSFQQGDLVVIYYEEPPPHLPTLDYFNSDYYQFIMAYIVAPITGGSGPTDPLVVTFGWSWNGVTVPAHFSRYDEEDRDLNATIRPTGFPMFVTPISVVRYDTQLNGPDLMLRRRVDFQNFVPVGTVDDFQVAYLVGTQPQVEQNDAPHPNPSPSLPIQPQSIVSGVRITVTARSAQENLRGSTQGASGDYIRKTFSSNISPRNILGGLQERTGGMGAN